MAHVNEIEHTVGQDDGLSLRSQTRQDRDQRVAILGMAFKAESDDVRESLSYKLRNLLSVYAREVLCTDPYVSDPTLVPMGTALEQADVIILGAPHSVYRDVRISREKTVVDVWNFWNAENRCDPEQGPVPSV